MYNKSELNIYYEKLRNKYELNNSTIIDKGMYYKYPYIFAELFPIKNELLDKFSMFYQRIVDHIIFVDRLLEGNKFDVNYIIEKYIVGNDLIREYSYVYEQNSIFWNYFEQFYKEYFNAILIENRLSNNYMIKFTKKEYLKMCLGKPALSKLLVAGMAIKSKNVLEFSTINNMLNYLNIYTQLLDDFKDIKEDLNKNQFNYYTYISKFQCNTNNKNDIFKFYLKKYLNNHIEDMIINLNKCYELFKIYNTKISSFGDIIDEQFSVINMIKEGMKEYVC
ncbi:hypothetical protein CPAST_c04750 [Clostridium pasteurianum DSM 525 = ATCC 6013]|uniref:Uncharacterized protein n=1 Tax=Clostridium pasteurianum DSM 525 = ATCC 6013 TaxID=1262449 RepID=A0A0H3J6J2_CLOPA|nr:class 1 isoprenoid biosynthesis enzyme [Clostridium pasteurianum]AJA46575.1 hypothetical protein CPAST_c04750 [Clostridium pasteurianum DSM 525 = ATCC 6013]AJA50563.1 hypothetical protein CLPA_c04750 [Clostridium pasteurianum DSM 525 = ATCC 6013]AOZ73994.1 hypothetical protein AQ983_02285 [Clostridium pasteurianum DSM 525 = ATCC 6013]AOZ77791.1 hypothetical protein AQ984_02285 [Clostridium pasteurianum]ELP61145.1 hypothetical protein F502_01780 [Clostridium pasteurianum DSM 525 = ATCC 6013]